VAVAVVVGAVMIVLAGGDSPDATPSPLADTAPAGTSRPQPPSAAPKGYKEHTAAGFSAAVPADWKLAASGGEATFSGPKDSGMRIVVEQVSAQTDGGLSELGRLETDGDLESYIQVQLQEVNYRGWKAADWEYTYTTPNGVPMHALTRYVTINDSTAFKIAFDLPELKWDDQAETRKVFLDTFRQTT
jgi:hypothetical protein